ncbi:uncharacterized protein KD926_004232 [Aspergillus affinis]|uniref:uncharacterized protein n=1 Tax=Aspergillus affinis TaxID=1070780 RepID=UPI0022FDC61E|nr:uncharacterized protein KD926_004232 [Aspergillus affinis]KAI9035263.1 hypothetical protein KD926_004232 [Aspergillus affinis]
MSANSTILGDSWVVEAAATPPPNKHRHEARQVSNTPASRATPDQTKKPPSSPRDKRTSDYGSESMATSVESISGPELIMPSIYETPVPEASWIAPNVRSPQYTIKRRHRDRERTQPKSSNPSPQKDRNSQGDSKPNHDQDIHPQNATDSDNNNNNTNNKPPLLHHLQPTLRLLLNALLLGSIAHLLVLPELITQHQTFFCSIPAIPSLYPSSCSPPHFHLPHNPIQSLTTTSTTTKARTPNHPPLTPEEQLSHHATRLERLFTSTLNTLTPLPPLLKQGESQLRALQTDIRTAFRGSRHELELEFSGLWDAARAGTRKLDSLSADLRSAVDNLIATTADTKPPRGGGAVAPAPADGDVSKGGGGGKGKGKGGGGEHGHEAAHAKAQARAAQITSAQLSRREAYLDQLTSRMQGKADALASDLATVEDHLESIERIILREDDSPSASSSSQPQEQNQENIHGGGNLAKNLITHLQSLRTEGLGLKALGLGRRGGGKGVHQPPSSHESSDPSKHETFVAATKGYRAVAEAVRNLSQRLDAVQGRKM